jgi:signal transduction histidine kinase
MFFRVKRIEEVGNNLKSKVYINVIVIIAGCIFLLHLSDLSLKQIDLNDLLIFIVLSGFLFIIKRYPMSMSSGLVSLDFPLIYLFIVRYGYIETAIVLVVVLIISEILDGRPARVYLFNVSNSLISLWIAHQFAVLYFVDQPVGFFEYMMHLTIYIVVYSIINNLLLDVLLWLRPHQYTSRQWFQKFKLEMLVSLASFGYGVLLYYLHTEQRVGDFFSYSFLYMPLVAGSLISHGTTQLAEEKQKLETLLQASKKMNESIELNDVVEGMEEAISKVVNYKFGIIYIMKQNVLSPERIFGHGLDGFKSFYLTLGSDVANTVLERKEAQLISNLVRPNRRFAIDKKETEVTALLAVPLILDKEVIGVIILGKEKSYSYFEEDKNILQTLANQASIALKNTRLVKEREKRIIVEERNRLAREMHDGIAQSIAAITIQIDSCIRVFDKKPTQVKEWLGDSLIQLRKSVKEIRLSIYSLRPKPTDTLGLSKALSHKLKDFQLTTNIHCEFQEKGIPLDIPKKLEEMIYEITSEALQNIYKHAQANKVQILMNYHHDTLDVFVRDNGIGFSLSKVLMENSSGGHFGLLNMNGLVAKCKGRFHVNSTEGSGTEIGISVPIIERAEDEVS